MRVALLSDIHGNEVGLRAVLADIRRQSVDQIAFLGDVATLGPNPRRAIELLAELDCLCIMGNHDAFLLEPGLVRTYTQVPIIIEAIDWCRDQLPSHGLELLTTFKPIEKISLGLNSMLVYRGSPRSNVEDILVTTPPEQLDLFFEGQHATVMAGGHTHLQMLRQHRGGFLLNVGSVGMPFKEYVAGGRPTILAHAEYAVVEEVDGIVSVTLHRVPLDKGALQSSVARTSNPLRGWLMQQYA